jgi:hypothetical protein
MREMLRAARPSGHHEHRQVIHRIRIHRKLFFVAPTWPGIAKPGIVIFLVTRRAETELG